MERNESRKSSISSKKIIYFDRIDSMFGSGRRDWSVDVLRCVSCFLVCAVHATNMTYELQIGLSGSNEWLHHEIYRTAFASPTVLFVMVSGIFFLSPERNVKIAKIWKKNVIKMAFAYIVWSFIYAIYRITMMDPTPELTARFMLQQWMIEPGHLWYIPMIIGLYILSPILRPITATYDTKLFRYIIAVFIGGLILWTIYHWPTFGSDESISKIIYEKTPMMAVCQYPFWMLFGWIAYTYRPSRVMRYIIYLLGIFSLLVGALCNIKNGCTPDDYVFEAVTQKFSIFMFLKNVALFYFIVTVFRHHRFSEFGKKFLRKWSDSTLIIYLIHYLILYILHNNIHIYDTGLSPWIGVWTNAIIAYVVGGIIALVFHMCWDPIKARISSRKSRSEKIYERIENKKKRV